MNKNILITIIMAIVLVSGAFLWIWNSEISPATVLENAPVPSQTLQN
ncbi:MAG TPA: hypothetical protein VJK04_00720 [Candidatus Paceibacterota bacterium]